MPVSHRRVIVEDQGTPPPYSSPETARGLRPQGNAVHNSQATEEATRPLPQINTNHLHPAYIPHYNHRSQRNHVSFAPLPAENAPQTASTPFAAKLQQHVYRITSVPSEDVEGNPVPANFWLPSPQTPQTLDSRRSGLQSFPVPPGSQEKRRFSHSKLGAKVRRWTVKFFVEWWMLEILSWCFSAACMVTIIVVLNHYQDKTIPPWPRYLTLNGFISVFSGFARAGLMLPTAEALGQLKWNIFRHRFRTMLDFERLDMASRGPWGALLLLLHTRKLSLSSIGAGVVLLSLPVDLFFQQIVHYPTVYNGNNPFCKSPAATTYNPRDGLGTFVGNQGKLAYRPPFDLYAYNALFLTNSSMPLLKAECPTNNCTWPVYDTLGVCSKCQDVTSLLYYDCKTTQTDWLVNGTNKLTSVFPNMTQCGYWLNDAGPVPRLMSGYVSQNRTKGAALGMRWLPVYDPFLRSPVGKGSFSFKDLANPIHNVVIAATPDGAHGAYRNASPHAQECIAYWCAQTVQTTYNAGGLREDILQSWPLRPSIDGDPWVRANASAQPFMYKANFSLTLQSKQHAEDMITFSISNLTAVETVQVFDPFSPSFLTMESEQQTNEPTLRWINALQSTPPTLQPSGNGDNPWLAENISEHFSLITKAMSYAVRNSPGDTNGLIWIKGTSWTQETVVQIRWAWIALPLTLLGTSLLFLVATIVRSSLESEHVGIWKTSALAILFNGLGDDVQQTVGPNCRMSEARTKAREIMVKLAPD